MEFGMQYITEGVELTDSLGLFDLNYVKGGEKSVSAWYSLRQQADLIQVTCFPKCKSWNGESLNYEVLLFLVQRVGKSCMESNQNANPMRNS